MKKQDYKCKPCDVWWTADWVDGNTPELFPVCPVCEGPSCKLYSFSTTRPLNINPHLTGDPNVTSMRQLKESFHIASLEAEERTGLKHDFQPVDLRDKDALGVTDEGLEPTYRRLHDEGRLKRRFIST